MVSGYDKTRPPDGYEPNIGWGGRIVLLCIVGIVLLGAFGWLLF